MDSTYDDEQFINQMVRDGRHRDAIGGQWDEIGTLQLEFLQAQGLRPHHALLDIGCGSLRGGVRFVAYLDPGCYYGVDRNQTLLDAGYDIELRGARLQDRLPRSNLICTDDFDCSRLGRVFDFALAQSLFTHLSFNRIRDCLGKVAPVMKPGSIFFATFFEAPEAGDISADIAHDPGGIVSHSSRDPYHYRLSDFDHACHSLPWSIRYIGDWHHPRAQHMLAFIRTS